MLSPRLWSHLQSTYGGPKGHMIDLMALDSNSQLDKESNPLPHYTPRYTPSSIGVNFFAQNPARVVMVKSKIDTSCPTPTC